MVPVAGGTVLFMLASIIMALLQEEYIVFASWTAGGRSDAHEDIDLGVPGRRADLLVCDQQRTVGLSCCRRFPGGGAFLPTTSI